MASADESGSVGARGAQRPAPAADAQGVEQKIVVGEEEKSSTPAVYEVSPLQARLMKRHAIFSKHPNLIAGAWFATCAWGASCIFGKITGGFIVQNMWDVPLTAALSAFLPAVWFGGAIANPKGVKSGWRAIGRGILIVLCAHALLPLLYLATHGGKTLFPAFPMEMFVLMTWYVGTIMGGMFTFPTGCIAAWLLYMLRVVQVGPQGCAVHGYGMIESDGDRS